MRLRQRVPAVSPAPATRGRRRRARAAVAGLAVLGLLTANVAASNGQVSAATPPAAAAGEQGGREHTVTLISGDRVRVRAEPDGRLTVLGVTAAPRPDGVAVAFQTLVRDKETHVVPADAGDLLAADALDLDLFNITELVASGYADGTADQVPVIVAYPEQRSDARQRQQAQALPAGTVTTMLESIDSAAVRVDKATATDFWASLDRRGPTAAAAPKKVWLDHRVTAGLDKSVPQVGAPAAWAAGFDGSGVRIAVLDTGIDAGHPDVAGKVADSRSFVPGVPAAADGNGHGTHVASTAAGTGAADGGIHQGVAPGAQLVVGKVLDDRGNGQASWLIEGMEWATRTAAADVVNISLGGDPSDGTDQMSQAVNALTASTGALFVIAAGNAGPRAQTIAAPGAADAALTVAAVDTADRLAGFSGRGPRTGNRGLKPDIAAPGVGIVAARAAGTSLGTPVDDRHTALSGTSMATPHVAGAAAILAQQHPDWDASRLKNALTGTAADVGASALEVGAGRLDVGRASAQGVSGPGGVDFGPVPLGDVARRTRTLTYTNRTSAPVTLALDATLSAFTGEAAPPGTVMLERDRLTVPAGADATVEVVLDPATRKPGAYQGVITATDTASGVRLRSATGAYLAPGSSNLTVEVVAPAGATDVKISSGLVVRMDGREDLDDWPVRVPGQASVTSRLLHGAYSVHADVSWLDGAGERQHALPTAPEVSLDRDTTVRFDLNDAERLTVKTPRPTEMYDGGVTLRRIAEGGSWVVTSELEPEYGLHNYWLLPTEPVHHGTFQLTTEQLRGVAPVTLRVVGDPGVRLHPMYQAPDDSVARFAGQRVVPVRNAGQGRPEDLDGLDVAGALLLITPTDVCTATCGPAIVERIARAAEAGAAGVLVAGPKGRVFLGNHRFAVPTMTLPALEADRLVERLARSDVRVRVSGKPQPDLVYPLAFATDGRIPADLAFQVRDTDLHRVDDRLHADRPGQTQLTWNAAISTNALSTTYVATSPGRLSEAIGPVSDTVVWTRSLVQTYEGQPGVDHDASAELYQGRGRRTESWFAAPRVPANPAVPADVSSRFPEFCIGLCRAGNTLMPWFWLTSNEPDHGGSATWNVTLGPDHPGPREAIRLYRDGTEVPLEIRGVKNIFAGTDWRPVFDLAPGPAEYRLTHHYPAPRVGQLFATEVDTDLTFRSQRPAPSSTVCQTVYLGPFAPLDEPCAAVSPLQLRYDAGVDLDNTAPAGRAHDLTITGYHNELVDPAPKVASLKLWVTFDDGGHWAQVPVRRGRFGAFTATVRHPALRDTAGAVGLRVEATDAAGNAIRQTVPRAYGLR